MRIRWIIFFGLLFSVIACETKSPPMEKKEDQSLPKVIVEREEVEREGPLPPEVKIKLKKDSKDSYSWELTGSDVDQILKVNDKLKRRLGGEASK